MCQEMVGFYLDSWSMNHYGKWPFQAKPLNDHIFRIFSLGIAGMFLSLLPPPPTVDHIVNLFLNWWTCLSLPPYCLFTLPFDEQLRYITSHFIFKCPALPFSCHNLNSRQHGQRTIFNFCSLAPRQNIQWWEVQMGTHDILMHVH